MEVYGPFSCRDMIRGCRELMSVNEDIYAVADEDVQTSEGVLRHFGFVADGEFWVKRWNG